ncbi:large-conductance mechanosensitive channel protein MscL [Lactococcus lactis]
MLREFKNFILRGNVLDLAVGVIIGSAFTRLVTSLVNDLINPLIGMFVQSTALANFCFYIGKTKFTYGAFLNDTINYVITAFVVFIIIKFVNRLIPHKEKEKQENQNKELDTLIEIRDLLKIKSK